jgi:eukaryotic-like serine/threonine-protein kinase
MNAQHWQRVSSEFDLLLDLSREARERRLAELRAQDPDFADELARLVAADECTGVLDQNVAQAAPTVMTRLASSEEPRAPAAAGKRVGHYRLVERVGSGGMGEVWRGERVDDFEQQVAIKLIRPLLDSPQLRERFARERRILARLDHPNIARLLDGGVAEDGTPWYAMEFVRGESITRYADQQALATRARVALLLQVCDAAAHAHTHLVIHRDLKPSNILVDAEGRARVLDFGIARLLDDSADVRLTGTDVRVFSPAYAAPEQIRGDAVGTTADVFALGAVLFELLSGALPYPARSGAPERLLANLSGETAPRPSDALRTQQTASFGSTRSARDLVGDLDTIVATALHPEAARRYAGAAQLGDDLRRWIDGRPIAARPDTAGYRMRKFVARHRIAVGSASAVLLALIAGLAAALWQADVARRHAARADAEARRATQQAEVANAVTDFLTRDVIQAANPFRNALDIKLVDALTGAGARIDGRFAGNPRLAGTLHRELADSLYLAGATEAGLAHAQQAIELLEPNHAPDDAELQQARLTLGRMLLAESQFSEARAVYERGAAALAPEASDAQRLPFVVGLAGLDVEERRENEAIATLDAALPRIAALGELEPLHMDALNHRLRALQQTDRFEEALATTRELREGVESRYGIGDPHTLLWLRREAIVLNSLERYAEALPLIERTCAATQAALGESHPALQECRLRQGVTLYELQRTKEAMQLIAPVAAVRERTLGAANETMWVTWVWLARTQQRLRQLDAARATFLKARDAARTTFGPESPNAIPFEQTYGMFLEQTGQAAEAEQARREILEKSQRVYPAGHVNIAKYAWDLGETLASRRSDAAYVAFCAEWMARWVEFFGEQDSRVVDAKRWLAEAQQRLPESAP